MPSVVFTPPLSEQVPAARSEERRVGKEGSASGPAGSDMVQADWVSVTVTVQVRSWPTTAGSWQSTEVVVERVSSVLQAAVGIRVHCVTGVQTCALPILWVPVPYADGV